MKKKILIITLSILAFALVIGAVILTVGLTENVETKIYTYTEASSINEIEVNGSATNYTIKKSDSDKIIVEADESNTTSYDISFIDGKLTIKENNQWRIASWKSKNVIIKIPNLEIKLNITTASGRIETTEISRYSNLIANSASGRISISQTNIKEAEIKTSSGSISISNVISSAETKIKSTSGTISIKDSQFLKELTTITASGNILIESSKCYNIDADTSSGNVFIFLNNLDIKTIDVETSSGNTVIKLPSEIAGFKAIAKSSSGNYRSNFDVNNPNHYGDGSIIINVDSSSGNITINK